MKNLRESGPTLVLSGVLQFVLSVALVLGFFTLLVYTIGGGSYNRLYFAACCGEVWHPAMAEFLRRDGTMTSKWFRERPRR